MVEGSVEEYRRKGVETHLYNIHCRHLAVRTERSQIDRSIVEAVVCSGIGMRRRRRCWLNMPVGGAERSMVGDAGVDCVGGWWYRGSMWSGYMRPKVKDDVLGIAGVDCIGWRW
ncbi:hypothetical protein L2E82_32069 [Cichorium intybus]|uniref:Uncharacterized protein n=1 Tax=Cichorium intybus TaxID=13427 RepID=A0ACB9BH03_CICIN|nr:hypothetical protein L2E82_32069 [Cichorium intybus]